MINVEEFPRRFEVRLSYGSTLSGDRIQLGTAVAVVRRRETNGRRCIKLKFDLVKELPVPEWTLANLRPMSRTRVIDYLTGNGKYPIVWSEDNGIETSIVEK